MAVTNDIPAGREPRRSKNTHIQPWEPSVRDLDIYAGLAEGKSTRQLGEEFDLPFQQVVRIGQKIDKWLAPQWMERIQEIKAWHTECLMTIFQESMAAWQASKMDAVSMTEKSTVTGDEISVTREEQCGDPSFLSTARAALAEIRKIWGVEAANGEVV
jgi:hypothetical protein